MMTAWATTWLVLAPRKERGFSSDRPCSSSVTPTPWAKLMCISTSRNSKLMGDTWSAWRRKNGRGKKRRSAAQVAEVTRRGRPRNSAWLSHLHSWHRHRARRNHPCHRRQSCLLARILCRGRKQSMTRRLMAVTDKDIHPWATFHRPRLLVHDPELEQHHRHPVGLMTSITMRRNHHLQVEPVRQEDPREMKPQPSVLDLTISTHSTSRQRVRARLTLLALRPPLDDMRRAPQRSCMSSAEER